MKTEMIINKISKEFEEEYGTAVLDVVPNWNEDGLLEDFTVHISIVIDDYTKAVKRMKTELDIDGLIDLLVELRGSHIDKYAVQVFAYYHGNETLRRNYKMLMDNLDLYEEFNMEYEWG